MYGPPIMTDKTDNLAHCLSEIHNSGAPIGWHKYKFLAQCLMSHYDMYAKPEGPCAKQVTQAFPVLETGLKVSWRPRGIGLNFGLPDLRTGEIPSITPDTPDTMTTQSDARPDVSGFVKSKADGHLACYIFGGNAHLDYRPSEPNWIQVKVSCDQETLVRLIDLVHENQCILTPEIVKKALG